MEEVGDGLSDVVPEVVVILVFMPVTTSCRERIGDNRSDEWTIRVSMSGIIEMVISLLSLPLIPVVVDDEE